MADGGGVQPNSSWLVIVGTALGLIGAPALFQKAMEHFFGRRKIDAEAKKNEAEGVATLMDAETRQFQALKDAWAERVNDLMAEIHDLRDEIISLRQAYDAQQKNHAEQMAAQRTAHSEQMAALRLELEEARKARVLGI